MNGLVNLDVGRLHYDYTAYVGNQGPDIAASYGEVRNRADLQPSGVSVFVGAGGPMGQMHVQRAIEKPDGSKVIIATEINDLRLQALKERFQPLAEKNGKELHIFNPTNAEESIESFVDGLSNGAGADDVVISVPAASLMEEGGRLMGENGMLVLFAGVPNGTYAPLDLSNVYLKNAQYTGTSGLTLNDQRMVMDRSLDGSLSPEWSVAAIGGLNVARDGIEAMMESRYPGKIVIFPQITDLPLMGLDEIEQHLPAVAEKLGAGNVWSLEAEAALFEHYL
jgi:threonine dehydrogenase-like Zn-dependent dehydrogenase